VFTLYLPVDVRRRSPKQRPSRKASVNAAPAWGKIESPSAAVSIQDDRAALGEGDRSILIIEDDSRFAKVLAAQCREQGFKVLAAPTGEEGIDLAGRFQPGGIVLDIKLPGIDGWRVLELLKENPETRHIPVHVMSVDEPTQNPMRKGAIGYVQKPVTADQVAAALEKMQETASRRDKRVLVVEDNEEGRKAIVELIADEHVAVDEAAGGDQAMQLLRSQNYDCLILDLGLWDFDGDELLERIDADEEIDLPPVIVYTARDLTWEEELNLRSYSESIIIKDVRSDERLLDEVTLFLHRVVAELPAPKRKLITDLHDTDALLRGKKVLMVDDDMRALFALSRMLGDRGMTGLKAENGRRALELLDAEPDVDIVLMDIMMPELDGYEAMRRIRAQEQHQRLPIIAVTAKAMPDDQQRCIEAGANDYLPKPVDQDRLISMLRIWLYR
jgi:CheY-like chemotaxis protein